MSPSWANSKSWWWTGKPAVLQFMGCRVGHDWVTELNWTELNQSHNMSCFYLAAYRFCMSTSPNQGYLRPSLSFHNKAFSLFCLPLSINQMSCDGWLPCYSKFWIKSLWLLSFGIKSQIKITQEKILEMSTRQNFNLFCASNYLYSIYTVLTTIYTAFTLH